MSVRVRIAPSPTGDPHVGTAYIALFNYCFARKHGGQFLLRIEDTDRTRSTRESEDAILRALRWLGLSWDEGPDVGGPHGPYRQSERADIYREHAEMLLSTGRAYRCFCTAERLNQLREQQKREKRPPGYDGLCRGIAPSESAQRAASSDEAHVVRLAMPREGKTSFKDNLRGVLEFDNVQIDDQVLLKSDGFPTYHLANVVDDHLMRITHVIRAEEWISSTPKHVVLYDAFGWTAPEWIHMPLLRNPDKSKISKRKNPVSLDYYRDAGVLPEALVNFLGLMGWSIGGDKERFALAEMIEGFSFDRVSLGGPVFDLEKLNWLNGLYLRDLSPRQIVNRLHEWRLTDDKLERVAALVRDRIRRLDEFVPLSEFFFSGDLDYTKVVGDLVPKGRSPKDTADILSDVADEYDGIRGPFVAAALEPQTRALGEKKGWKTKELFMTLRIVMTGRTASPPLFETMEVLGRELVRRRMRLAIDFLSRQRG
ncbi:MAG: glutamate--tRNA ligase [Deltaproteobacteria bacterium]|nr:glutamate--tRNA ligase [Deltaproteobacteria bacterium]